MRASEVRELLRSDYAFYAEHALKIIAKNGEVVPLRPKPGQMRLYDALARQRQAGEPERAIILKARQLGFSTSTQGMLLQRVTQRPNHRGLVVAQDIRTASALFDMGRFMLSQLPDELAPHVTRSADSQNNKYLYFGPESKRASDRGLNSELRIDTAREVTAGRGLTIHSLHISELAFYDYPEKLTALLNAVPREPGTLVVLESTANGHNHFKERWDRAEAGESAFAPIFAPWFEEPSYAVGFHSAAERAEFVESIGTGAFGEAEPGLQESFDLTPEQLHWRRLAIVDECDSDVEVFRQEFPSTPAEAFRSSGAAVFSISFVNAVRGLTELSDPAVPSKEHPGPERGLLQASAWKVRKLMQGPVEVPTAVAWVPATATGFGPRHDFWRVWEQPAEDGQYVLFADVAAGEGNVSGDDTDYSVACVVNHKTLEQVAEFRTRMDPYPFAEQIHLAALHWGQPWVAVETTGNTGLPVVKQLWREFRTPKLYKRHAPQTSREREQDLLGFDTNRRTKPMMEALAKELLREGTHGIRSAHIAREMGTYIVLSNGRHGAQAHHHDDALMAWMGAQVIAAEKFVMPERPGGGGAYRYVDARNRKTGY